LQQQQFSPLHHNTILYFSPFFTITHNFPLIQIIRRLLIPMLSIPPSI
jgi:hypothetical protein